MGLFWGNGFGGYMGVLVEGLRESFFDLRSILGRRGRSGKEKEF